MQDGNTVEINEDRDVNDIFSDIFLSENRIFETSFREGFEEAEKEENIEAFHLGYHRGAEIGAEIGYYEGIVEYYLKTKPGDEKIIKDLTALQKLLETFPRQNDLNVDVLELLNQVRSKFKKICALLKIHTNFRGKTDTLSF